MIYCTKSDLNAYSQALWTLKNETLKNLIKVLKNKTFLLNLFSKTNETNEKIMKNCDVVETPKCDVWWRRKGLVGFQKVMRTKLVKIKISVEKKRRKNIWNPQTNKNDLKVVQKRKRIGLLETKRQQRKQLRTSRCDFANWMLTQVQVVSSGKLLASSTRSKLVLLSMSPRKILVVF